jgi:ribosomal protein S7
MHLTSPLMQRARPRTGSATGAASVDLAPLRAAALSAKWPAEDTRLEAVEAGSSLPPLLRRV